MAVSAVYADIVRCTLDSQAGEAVSFSNISSTTAAFPLKGGTYQLAVMGTTFGSVTLQRLAADGSTWLTAATAIAANGCATVTLARGSYRFALA